MSQGYIYALINPSLHDLIKVGKTEKDPEIRAKEISSDSDVPTPFIVVFKVFVCDCDAGELFLHALLETKGYIINQNSDFINVPLGEIISAMNELQKISGFNISSGNNQFEKNEIDSTEFNFDDDFLNELEIEQEEQMPAFVDVLYNAEDLYYGVGDTIQDYSDALALYKYAAELGGIEAYERIGRMYKDGEGCRIDPQFALKYFKEGANNGNENCYFFMGILFAESNNYDNMNKCFRKYFLSSTFLENKQYWVLVNDRINNVYVYFSLMDTMGLEIETDILQNFVKLKFEIINFFESQIEYVKSKPEYKTLIDVYEAKRKKMSNLLDSLQ